MTIGERPVPLLCYQPIITAIEYTVPNADTTTSLAAIAGIKVTICQPKPWFKQHCYSMPHLTRKAVINGWHVVGI